MQSLVPRAIAIIANGGQAKYFGDKFNFPCACVFGGVFFDFSRGKSFSTFCRVERLSLVDNWFITIQVFSRNDDTVVLRRFRTLFKRFGQHRTAKIFPGFVLARSHYRLSRWSDSNPIPQKLTLLEVWPYLKCLHGKKLALYSYKDNNLDFTSAQIWHNCLIRIENKPIFYKSWFIAGVKDVKDILDTDGNSILSYAAFTAKYKIKTNFLEFYEVVSAVNLFWQKCPQQPNRGPKAKTFGQTLLASEKAWFINTYLFPYRQTIYLHM